MHSTNDYINTEGYTRNIKNMLKKIGFAPYICLLVIYLIIDLLKQLFPLCSLLVHLNRPDDLLCIRKFSLGILT